MVEQETYHRTSSGSFIIIFKRNLPNKSVKHSTWFLCHFYGKIHRIPTLKPKKSPYILETISVDIFNSLSLESERQQVSRTLLSILADLNKAVVRIISILPPISHSPSHLETVPSAPITIGITVTFMFHNFFCSLAWFKYFFPFFDFHRGLPGRQSPLFGKFSFFFFFHLFYCLLSQGLVFCFGIWWSVCMWKT